VNAYAAVKMAWQTNSVGDINSADVQFDLFPNPNKGNFNLKFDSQKADDAVFEVLDLEGKVIYSCKWRLQAGKNQKQINLSNLAKGFYVARISTATAQTSGKLILE